MEAATSTQNTMDDQGSTTTVDPACSVDQESIIMDLIENVVSKYWDVGNKKIVINKEGASVSASIMNLSNTIMGAGLLGLPWAISLSGYFLSIIFFIVFGFLSAMGLNLSMAAAKTLSPYSTYYTMSLASIPSAKKLVDASVAFVCFMACTAFLVIIGDVMPQVIQEFASEKTMNDHDFITNRRFWIFIFFTFILLPIVALKKMDAFKYTSALSMACLAYTAVIVIMFASGAMDSQSDDHEEMAAFPSDFEFLKVIPVFLFAFTCHMNAFSITNEMKNNTMSRLNVVIFASIGGCTLIYSLVGFCGYYAYGNDVDENILVSLPETWPVTIARMGIALVVTWSFPLILHPARTSLASLFWNTQIEKLSNVKFYVLTYAVALGAFGFAMTGSSLGLVFSITGSIGCPIISFVLPGMFYYYLQDQSALKEDKYYMFKRRMAMFLIVFGSFVIPFGLTVTFVYA